MLNDQYSMFNIYSAFIKHYQLRIEYLKFLTNKKAPCFRRMPVFHAMFKTISVAVRHQVHRHLVYVDFLLLCLTCADVTVLLYCCQNDS